MRLFFVLLTVAGSVYLLVTDRGERRYAIAALVGQQRRQLKQGQFVLAESIQSIAEQLFSTCTERFQVPSHLQDLCKFGDLDKAVPSVFGLQHVQAN